MQIHELNTIKRKKRKTIGRGGKRGTYSGKGNKGQKARSGGSVDPLFEGGRSTLLMRLKKVRGFKSRKPKNFTLNLDDLEKKFKDGEVISKKTLSEVNMIKKDATRSGIKILGTGKITKKLSIEKGILLSETAKNAIIKAGGTIE